jgi:hypothetical protein
MSCVNCEAEINSTNASLTILYKGQNIGSICASCTPAEQKVAEVMLSILFPADDKPTLQQYQCKPRGF